MSSQADTDSDSDSDDDASDHEHETDDSDDDLSSFDNDEASPLEKPASGSTQSATTVPPPPEYSHSPFAFPVRLARPTYREVSREALTAIDPELADVPIEYIRDGLRGQGTG